MKKLFIVLLAIGLGLAGCKNDDIVVTLVQNGNLSVKLIDNDGSPVSEAEVVMYTEDSEGELEELTTDENGVADFGTLNVGSYFVVIDAELDGKDYEFYRGVQVVAGGSKQYEINVESYVGRAKVQVRNSYNGQDLEISGLKTALVQRNDEYEEASGMEEILALAIATQETDNEGEVEYLDVPVGSYYVFYHNDEEILNSSSVYIDKDETDYVYFSTYIFPALFSVKPTWSIASVVNEDDGTSVANDYVSVVFDLEDNEIVLSRSGGLEDVEGSFYFNSAATYIDFNWDVISDWDTSVVSITQDEIVLEYYDYNLSEGVIMTLN